MLVSEMRKWHFAISWDNPDPPDSSSMLKSLNKLGKLYEVETKTTVVLAPNSDVSHNDVREAVRKKLNPTKGNAIYINLKSRNIFECGAKTNFKWKKAN
jgi:hypothetical protein